MLMFNEHVPDESKLFSGTLSDQPSGRLDCQERGLSLPKILLYDQTKLKYDLRYREALLDDMCLQLRHCNSAYLELQSANARLLVENNSLKDLIILREHDLQSLSQKLSRIQLQLSEKVHEVASKAAEQIAQVRKQHDETVNFTIVLTKQLEAAHEELDRLRHASWTEKDSLRAELARLRAEALALADSDHAKSAELLKVGLRERSRQAADLALQAEQLERSNRELAARCSALQLQVDAARHRGRDLDRHALESKLADQAREMDDLRAASASQAARASAALAAAAALRRELSRARARAEALERALASARAQVAAAEDTAAEGEARAAEWLRDLEQQLAYGEEFAGEEAENLHRQVAAAPRGLRGMPRSAPLPFCRAVQPTVRQRVSEGGAVGPLPVCGPFCVLECCVQFVVHTVCLCASLSLSVLVFRSLS
jgi:hypothetical protein